MSHFTVAVKVSEERNILAGGAISEVVEEMLAPYDEGTKDSRFLSFVDEEKRWRKEYENESFVEWEGENSRKKLRFDKKFQTFKEFCKGWYNAEATEDGKFGYIQNPNAKWDWYMIGGRWAGFFPTTLKVGNPNCDVILFKDVDVDAVKREQDLAIDRFLSEYKEVIQGKKFPTFQGPRAQAFDFGLLRCLKAIDAYKVKSDDVVVQQDNGTDLDVYKVIPDDGKFKKQYAGCFNPLNTYAAVDDEGWHDPGKMGWFGCSHAKSKDKLKFTKNFFNKFILSAKPNDALVLIDCHILYGVDRMHTGQITPVCILNGIYVLTGWS